MTPYGCQSENKAFFIPKGLQTFTYDDDGNLTQDSVWDYTYDAENRLVSMQTHTALSPSPFPNADARRLEFKYDYLGRRVEKLVRKDYNGTIYATVESQVRYLYDGWNLLFEFDALNSLAKLNWYVWGLDLSGTLQGAGGVGGLLQWRGAANDTPEMVIDDGGGNIHGGVTRVAGAQPLGTISSAYEYDAYGDTLRESGVYAATGHIRFSTKYTDIETGLIYHDTRYYSPSLGRFITRDSIGEQGGLNLYAYVSNRVPNAWDMLGMADGEGWQWASELGNDGQWYTYIDWAGGLCGQDYMDRNIAMANASITGTALVPTDENGQMVAYTSMGSTSYDSIMAKTAVSIAINNMANAMVSQLSSGNGSKSGEEKPLESDKKSAGFGSTVDIPTTVDGWKERFREYLDSKFTSPSRDEAFIAGAIRAALTGGDYYRDGIYEGHVKAFDKYEYVWGVDTAKNGQYFPTAAITNMKVDSANQHHNPYIMNAYYNGSLSAIAHNHPNLAGLSGYDGGGAYINLNKTDRGVAIDFKVPVYMIDSLGFQYVGGQNQDDVRTINTKVSPDTFRSFIDTIY